MTKEISNTPASRLSTRIAFLVAGFGIACWAPLVPLVKIRLAIDDGHLGLLLLCLGIGSLFAMMTTGMLASRFGAKPIILTGGIGLSLCLPLLHISEHSDHPFRDYMIADFAIIRSPIPRFSGHF